MSERQREPRFVLDDVTSLRRGEPHAKFMAAITIGRIAELWELGAIAPDYDVQRGEKEVRTKGGIKLKPMLDRQRIHQMTEKILRGDFHGGSLCWNMREGQVEYDYYPATRQLAVWSGTITIPDSNHRHHAFLEVAKRAQRHGSDFFDCNTYESPLVIEVLNVDRERQLFYEYNQEGKPANPTRSKVLNQSNVYSKVGSYVRLTSHLGPHIELVTNNVSKNSAKVVTFNTLVSAVTHAFPHLDDVTWEGCAQYLVEFLDVLVAVRPETGYLPVLQRQRVRDEGIGDSGLAFQCYIDIAAHIRDYPDWARLVSRLGLPYRSVDARTGVVWEGDLMARSNPLWRGNILSESPGGGMAIVNRKASRSFMTGELLRVMGLMEPQIAVT